MPQLRKRKLMSELLDLHDPLRCQSFQVNVPPSMTGGGSSCDTSDYVYTAYVVYGRDNMGYGRDFAASMIYSMEENGQPLDFNTLFGKIMPQGETSRNFFEAMVRLQL